MNQKSQKFIDQIAPYLMIGIGIALLVTFVIMFIHIFFIGLIIGLVLFGINYIKTKFFGPKKSAKADEEKEGRIIEHDDTE